jgi:hypothetical protein
MKNSITKQAVAFLIVTALVAAAVIYVKHSDSNFLRSKAPVPEITQEQAREALSGMPLTFQENKGQTDPSVRFLMRGSALTVFFTDTTIVYSHSETIAAPTSPEADEYKDAEENKPTSSRTLVIKQTFQNALAQNPPVGKDALNAKINYFIGNDESKWVKEAATYSSVHYESLYPGIHATIDGISRRMKTVYQIEPGSKSSDINIKLEGQNSLALDAAGNLVMETEFGGIALAKPIAYQNIDGRKSVIGASFVLTGKDSFTFALEPYDTTQAITMEQ